MILLEKRIKSLSRGLSSSLTKLAKEVTPKSVHHLRTTIRRVETLLASHPLDLNKKQQTSQKKLAELRRRAGKVRDFDVQLGLLGAIANGSTATDRIMLGEYLQRKREKQAERLTAEIEDVRASKFSSHMKGVFQKASEAPQRRGSPGPLVRARRQLSALGAGFLDQHDLKPNLLHDVRIKLKKVRYLAELGEESEEQRSFLSELKAVQDALGTWHDWQELANTAEKQFGDRANCPLLLEIRALFAARQSAAQGAVAQLFARNVRKQPRPTDSVRALAKRA
jgi:CHAD domain-containing protein